MPKTILGVQLTSTAALAVHLKWGWKGATVDRVMRVELPRSEPQERGAALLAAGLPHVDAVVAGLRSDEAFQRVVELPFADRNKVAQAAPLEAEESLPLALEDLVCHTHLLKREGGRSTALLAAVPRERLSHLLEGLRLGGLEPQIVDVEALALVAVARASVAVDDTALVIDLSPDLCQAVLLGPGGPWSFCAFSSASAAPALLSEIARHRSRWEGEGRDPRKVFLCGPDATAQDLGVWRDALGISVEILPLPGDGIAIPPDIDVPWPGWAIPLGLALREGQPRGASQINLLQGSFLPERGGGPWKRTALQAGIYGALLVVLWGLGVWGKASYEEAQHQALSAAVREEFQKALPEVTNIVSEIDQMKARVTELESRAMSLGSLVDREVTPLSLLREISARIPKDLETEFRDFTVEEGRVRIDGVTTSFDAAEKIRADLSEYPRFRRIPPPDAKTAPEPGKVVFKLTIGLGQEG